MWISAGIAIITSIASLHPKILQCCYELMKPPTQSNPFSTNKRSSSIEAGFETTSPKSG